MTMPSTPPFPDAGDPPSGRVAAGLSRIALALRTRAWQEGGRRGLNPTQAQILAFLRSRGGARLGEIADGLAVTPATASDSVSALARKRLVRKTAEAGDGRAVVVALTARGRAEAERAAGWPDFLRDAVDALGPGEQAVLLRGLVKIVRTLQDRGYTPPARLCATCRFFRPHAHPDPERPHHCAFVDAPFGDRSLRLDCRDHEPASREAEAAAWAAFAAGGPVAPLEKGDPT